MGSSKQKGKSHVQADPESHPSSSDVSLSESDSLDDSNCSKYRSKNLSASTDDSNYRKSKRKKCDKIKSVGNTGNRTRQTHRQEILIRPTTVTIDARAAKIRRPTG